MQFHKSKIKILKNRGFFLLFLFLFLLRPNFLWAKGFLDEMKGSSQAGDQGNGSVELNGDVVEYSVEGNKLTAHGNVVIVHKDATLTCDKVEFYRQSQVAYAYGNVHLNTKMGEIICDKLKFEFTTMKGDLSGARINADPYYGEGASLYKVEQNKIVMQDGYLTTCDLDKPHWRIKSKKMDIYPKDKLIARGVKFVIGSVPILYLPKFTQDISGKQPLITFTPGESKQWGLFLLTQLHLRLTDNVNAVVHLDARERKDIAEGLDLSYKSSSYGEGTVNLYYMKERPITVKHFYKPRTDPTPEHERFKAQWRHKWDIDEKTKAIVQYSKLSGANFLKEYFPREFQKDQQPQTFFLLTKQTNNAIMSFQANARVNRFYSAVERLPELIYDFTNKEILESGLYFKSKTTYSNLVRKDPSPSEARLKTSRVDLDSEFSYPLKISFLEFTPFVGGESTYYNRLDEKARYDSIRGIFRTGAILTTKVYKLFDFKTDILGLNIDRLRHVITPTISYNYDHAPTIPSTKIPSFDPIDSRDIIHSINFKIENKLQTKRNLVSLDLARLILETDFRLKDHPSKGGFDDIRGDLDILPNNPVTFHLDSRYDTHNDRQQTVNFDLYIKDMKNSRWSWDFGKRWERDLDDQISSELTFKINPKWKIRILDRIDALNGLLKVQEYTITRDLHSWEMEINFNETRTQGDEIWLLFRLKAFPNMKLDLGGAGFNKRKTGSQNLDAQ